LETSACLPTALGAPTVPTSSYCAVNLPADAYFALIAPACVILLGMVLAACWWVQRRQPRARFLLWLATGYVLPALALGAQSLMGNAQLARWAVVTGLFYLGGAWCLAEGMSRRHEGGGRRGKLLLGLVVSAVTLGLLYYHSRVHNDLWARVQWLNVGVGLLLLLGIDPQLRALAPQDRLERALRWTYVVFAVYNLIRSLVVWLLPVSEVEVLTRSGYWLMTLAGTLLFTMWFSLVLLACAVRDVLGTMREERNRDPLTRLLNRRAFMEAAEISLRDPRCGPWAVVVGDIDHFKRVNDSWGHASGDQVLQGVSQVLQQQVQEGDLVARFGGEEFVVLMQRAPLHLAERVAQRMRLQLGQMVLPALPAGMPITASFGIAAVGSLQQLTGALARADALLYLAKQTGRDRVVVESQATVVASQSAAC